jgi:hypothetical protein
MHTYKHPVARESEGREERGEKQNGMQDDWLYICIHTNIQWHVKAKVEKKEERSKMECKTIGSML